MHHRIRNCSRSTTRRRTSVRVFHPLQHFVVSGTHVQATKLPKEHGVFLLSGTCPCGAFIDSLTLCRRWRLRLSVAAVLWENPRWRNKTRMHRLPAVRRCHRQAIRAHGIRRPFFYFFVRTPMRRGSSTRNWLWKKRGVPKKKRKKSQLMLLRANLYVRKNDRKEEEGREGMGNNGRTPVQKAASKSGCTLLKLCL